MHHPALLFVPVLLISDHLLTVAGARMRDRGYSQHIRTEHYELNPAWQKEIARKRWLNPRHLFLVAVIAVLLYGVGEFLIPGDDPAIDFMCGLLFGAFGAINGRHLANLATFMRLQRYSANDLDGQITFSHEYALRTSLYQFLQVLMPLALLCLLAPTPILLGGATGVALLMLLHAIWIARWRRKAAQAR